MGGWPLQWLRGLLVGGVWCPLSEAGARGFSHCELGGVADGWAQCPVAGAAWPYGDDGSARWFAECLPMSRPVKQWHRGRERVPVAWRGGHLAGAAAWLDCDGVGRHFVCPVSSTMSAASAKANSSPIWRTKAARELSRAACGMKCPVVPVSHPSIAAPSFWWLGHWPSHCRSARPWRSEC